MAKTTTQTPGRRQRSEKKRAAILDAAEALFVTSGYELTSVDAIAARADVSKRTLYDHFGDKQLVFQSVLARVRDALTVTVRTAIDEELTQGRDLREALTAFAMRLATEAFPSSDYVTFRRLMSEGKAKPGLSAAVREVAVREYPERLLEERFAKLVADGHIRAADPRRAVQHFSGLTMLLAVDAFKDEPDGALEEGEIPAIIADGVDVFLRAYR